MPEVPPSEEERFIMPDTVDPKERSSLPEGVTGEHVLRKLPGSEEPGEASEEPEEAMRRILAGGDMDEPPDTTGDTGVEGGVDAPNEDADEPEDDEGQAT
jgi:hypothetical protein